ncbi:MAG TPA: hypothetical protein VFQ05_09810 [Candidatus Eisenbacteria bacterium]|nr:hypothetical protein [Candidatus Eisenbacteria bacterium]
MSFRSRFQRLVTIAVMAAVVLGTVAPLAEAKKRHRRYKGRVVERRVVVERRPVYRSVRVVRHAPYARYTVWRSERGPVIAGFLGGLFLGATLSNAAPYGFVYWDSYCDRGFASLEMYDVHLRRHPHEHVIQVVEAPYGYESVDLHSCPDCGGEYWGDEHLCDE